MTTRRDRARREINRAYEGASETWWENLCGVLWSFWFPHVSWRHRLVRWLDPALGEVLDSISAHVSARLAAPVYRYYVSVVVSGVDYDDEALIDRLHAAEPSVHWGRFDGEVQAMMFVESDSLAAVEKGVRRVEATLPVGARVVRVANIEREHPHA